MFNKELYWNRRRHVTLTENEEGEITSSTPAPMRGQSGGIPEPTIAKWTEEDAQRGRCSADEVGRDRISGVKIMKVGGRFMAFNRRQRRSVSKDRKFTKKNHHFGMKVGGRQYNLVHHLAKIQAKK